MVETSGGNRPSEGSAWYYAQGSERVGPVSEKRLIEVLEAGLIDLTNLVWTGGMENWLPVRDVPTLAKRLVEIPPPLPSAGPLEELASPQTQPTSQKLPTAPSGQGRWGSRRKASRPAQSHSDGQRKTGGVAKPPNQVEPSKSISGVACPRCNGPARSQRVVYEEGTTYESRKGVGGGIHRTQLATRAKPPSSGANIAAGLFFMAGFGTCGMVAANTESLGAGVLVI